MIPHVFKFTDTNGEYSDGVLGSFGYELTRYRTGVRTEIILLVVNEYGTTCLLTVTVPAFSFGAWRVYGDDAVAEYTKPLNKKAYKKVLEFLAAKARGDEIFYTGERPMRHHVVVDDIAFYLKHYPHNIPMYADESY